MRYPGICAAVFGLAAVMSLGLAACGAVQDESSTAERSAAREESAVETVTDVNGQAVLDENGEPMTEIVTVAAVEVPSTDAGSPENGGGARPAGTANRDHLQSDEPYPANQQGETTHIHTWVQVSPENSRHMDYGVECRAHGNSGGEPMFFRTQNDLFLHQAADGCTSGWGSGFKGLAYQYCSGCGAEVITGHVHDFGTVAKTVYFEKVLCECGMSFTAGKDYTALQSWNTHVQVYTSYGRPREEHDSYQTVTDSVTRYEAAKACTCGWRPVDNRPVY